MYSVISYMNFWHGSAVNKGCVPYQMGHAGASLRVVWISRHTSHIMFETREVRLTPVLDALKMLGVNSTVG